MHTHLFVRRAYRLLSAGALALTLASLAASPALAATAISTSSVSTSSSNATASSTSTVTSSSRATTPSSANAAPASCAMPAFSEPFASFGDSNLYAAVPGNAFDSFAGTGWTLSRGASIKTATLADRTTGSVLDLPAGAKAVSPPMCVAHDYPTARIIARALTRTQSLTLLASYLTSNTTVTTSYSNSSPRSAWALSPVLQTHPRNQTGWQLVVFTLEASSTASDTQVYNFYIDPRMVG